MLDLNDLYYFSVVVEKRSFSAAAEVTGVPKGTLSKRMRALEQTLGLRLANRTTRTFSLTEAGEDIHQHCLRVMNEVRGAQMAAQARLSEPVGRVRITCSGEMVSMALEELMPRFLARYPKIDIVLLTASRYVDLVDEGFDLALRSHTAPLQNCSLIARQVAQTHCILVASPAFFADGEPSTPQELDGVAGLQLKRADLASVWRVHASDGRTAAVTFHPKLYSNSARLARKSAIAGQGVALLPQPLCCDDIAQGRLIRVLPDWHIPRETLSLVFPSQRGMTQALRTTVDFLADELPGYLSQ
ncbi:LysR substrate-binding domain-containing protein [Paraburkholderia sp. CI3]|uniref:LysR substrate-binding domain-containing protein n=1 Tax=Paraburkholderia sp. CI3 TaxID=2991060 RepID=UPI003D23ED8C